MEVKWAVFHRTTLSLTPALSRWEKGRDRLSLDDSVRLARGRGEPVAPSPGGRGPG